MGEHADDMLNGLTCANCGERIAVTDDPRAFPLLLSGDRIGRQTNSFAGEGWGISP